MELKLICLDLLAPQGVLFLNRLPAVIGRDPSADVRIHERWIGRHHCLLEETDGVLSVRDLQSTHGTRVNGCRVTQSMLMSGDTLTVGMSNFRVAYRPAEPAASTPVRFARPDSLRNRAPSAVGR